MKMFGGRPVSLFHGPGWWRESYYQTHSTSDISYSSLCWLTGKPMYIRIIKSAHNQRIVLRTPPRSHWHLKLFSVCVGVCCRIDHRSYVLSTPDSPTVPNHPGSSEINNKLIVLSCSAPLQDMRVPPRLTWINWTVNCAWSSCVPHRK